MKLRVVLLGLVAFLVALFVVLPARWAGALLPATLGCAAWTGSIWNGACSGLTVERGAAQPFTLEQLRWQMRPLALLRLTPTVDFTASWPDGQASGRFERRPGGALAVRDVTANARLDRRMLGALPAGWNGRLQVRELNLAWQGTSIHTLEGDVQALDLNDGRGAALGGYQFRFAPGDGPPFTGQVNDTGNGPLEVAATLRIEADRSWALDGTVARRPGTDPALDRRLDLLGPADASGRRPLSAAGSFN